jgi:ribonuclease BN (tRNA processing enzyme)
MQLRILGCSGGIGGDRQTTSMLVDEDVLIDCGTGVGNMQLEEMRKLRHIFLTHTHLDHIANLPLLVDTLFSDLLEEPLIIHALEESMEVIKNHIFNWQIWPDFFELPTKKRPSIAFQPMEAGEIRELGGRSFEMIAVNHTVPAVGYRVSDGKGSFAFTGDTTTNDSFWQALNRYDGLDLLVAECAFSNEERELSKLAKHYCPETLAEDMTKLKHDPRIFVTHLKPGDEEHIFNQVTDALGDRRVIRLSSEDLFQL